MLDDAQLRAAWQQHAQSTNGDAWRKAYRGHIEAIDAATPDELASRAWQERLWRDKSITPVGPGDGVNVTALYEDHAIVQRIVDLRSLALPNEVEQRAQRIQGLYNELLAIVATRDVRVKPAAKLMRIFAGLLPRELTCIMSYRPNLDAASLLLGPTRRAPLELHVLMRQRLRNVLGPEQGGREDDVQRSTFCWWLHENHADLSASGSVKTTTGLASEPDEPATLLLWPFGKQWKSSAAIKGFDRYYRDVVQAAVAGVARDELVELIRADPQYSHQQPQSVRHQISFVKGLGLLDDREGLLRPTAEGEELLEIEQPDVLVRLLIERVFGYAQLLERLNRSPRPVPTAEVVAGLQSIYPNWTSGFAPRALLGWCDALGLVDQRDGAYSISDYGRGWAARLPAALPLPPKESAVETSGDADQAPAGSGVGFPTFTAIWSAMQRDPLSATFVFEPALVAALDAGWRMNAQKRFVILSGLSGTGKTAITGCYARAVCASMGLEPERHFTVVPVSPDWRDPTSLFGYFNALGTDPTYQPELTLRVVLRAAADPSRPYFLVLDEMNLARVERYFAPMLSAMETGLSLDLHANEGPINGVPPSVPWPRNLYIAGTVNMDESTHPFSDKVLDRAVTLEFWRVDLQSFFARRAEPRDAKTEDLLTQLNQRLEPIRRHFGYRTAGEVLDFVGAMNSAGAIDGLDLGVFGKVLPRLRGEQSPGLEAALAGLHDLCKANALQRCSAKLESMLADLRHTGMTRFWA